jgi:hypothetical protein
MSVRTGVALNALQGLLAGGAGEGDAMTKDKLLALRRRLTDRDLLLLDWLADHDVLTTFQIAHALFGSLRVAQRRLGTLLDLGLVDRFRPYRSGGGTHPMHYVLGHEGAQFMAAARDEPEPRSTRTSQRIRRIAASRTLDHRLGVNQFFTDLAGTARVRGGAELERWWSERRCAEPGAFRTGLMSPVRPDGHGIWNQDGQRVAYFLEYDAGSEGQRVLMAKLDGYDQHVRRGGPAWPVLFWLPSTAREQNLHRLLDERRSTGRDRVLVATAALDRVPAGDGPADTVWLVSGAGEVPRRLVDLAAAADGAPAVEGPGPRV